MFARFRIATIPFMTPICLLREPLMARVIKCG
jgi:hypothetical protein